MLGLLSRLLVLSVYDAGHLNLVALLTLKIMAIQGPAILSNPLVKKKKKKTTKAGSVFRVSVSAASANGFADLRLGRPRSHNLNPSNRVGGV